MRSNIFDSDKYDLDALWIFLTERKTFEKGHDKDVDWRLLFAALPPGAMDSLARARRRFLSRDWYMDANRAPFCEDWLVASGLLVRHGEDKLRTTPFGRAFMKVAYKMRWLI